LLEPTLDSGGIPAAFAELVAVAPWNDLAAVERAFERFDLAAVIMEPINYNAGCLTADVAYMQAVRDIATAHGTVLIYDEILSGFRTGVDCGQGYYGVTPDLALLGKAVANGVPLAVITGRREVMETLSPLGSAVHSGTYSGHLFGVMAALATTETLMKPGFYDGPEGLLARAEFFYGGLREIFSRHHIRCRVQGLGSRFGLYFGLDPDDEVKVYQEIVNHDFALLNRFVRACFERGVYFHTYDIVVGHHGFGAAHTRAELSEALEKIDAACGGLGD
jgi:glutamate-1-semialdehyde 2,1-aminomutase